MRGAAIFEGQSIDPHREKKRVDVDFADRCFAVKSLGVLRISEEVEIAGIDIHEHGAPAFHPEFAYMGHSAIPSGSASSSVKLPSSDAPSVGVGD